MTINVFRLQALVGKIDPDVRSTGKTQDVKEYLVQKITTWMYALLALGVWLLPLEGRAQTTVKYIHTDALGSVVAMTGPTGAAIETTREYEPYGYQSTPAIQDGPGYTGHVQDAATGLTYMQQRYYDPSIGRFLSVDPVTAYSSSDWRQLNRYAYAFNNPYKFTDPDGRQSTARVLKPIFLPFPIGGQSESEDFAGGRSGADGPLGPGGRPVRTDREGNPILQHNESSYNESDAAVKGLTAGLPRERDSRGREVKGNFVDESGSPQDRLDGLPGEIGENGQKVLPDGSVAGIHTSTSTGDRTLHINRPLGKQDIKVRYPEPKEAQ